MAEPTQTGIEELLNAEFRAERDSDFADSIKFTTRQLEGTRYVVVLSEQQPER